MKTRLQLGGIAAVVCALCYIIGFTMILVVMPDINIDGEQRLQAILSEPRLIQSWYFIIFVIRSSFDNCFSGPDSQLKPYIFLVPFPTSTIF